MKEKKRTEKKKGRVQVRSFKNRGSQCLNATFWKTKKNLLKIRGAMLKLLGLAVLASLEFTWDEVKVDKHRENYLGHSIKAPVGRWQKGKDLHWYARDKKSQSDDMEAAKEEIKRIKEEEEQAMREALGLAPKRSNKPQKARLDKHELSELTKRGSTAEDVGAGHAEAARVGGIGFARAPAPWDESSSQQSTLKDVLPEKMEPTTMATNTEKNADDSDDERRNQKRQRREEKKREKHEKREKRHSRDSGDMKEKRHSRDSDRKGSSSKRDKGKRRHDSD